MIDLAKRAFSRQLNWLLLATVITVSLGARASDFRDEDLKAVYLYRFAFLIDWKTLQPTSGRYAFCSDSDNEVSLRLKDVVARKPDQASFTAITQQSETDINCHIVYTANTSAQHISTLRTQFPDALVVGEGNEFTANGGMAAFVKMNNRVRPLINLNNLQYAPFSLRSQLLSISIIEEGDNA
ncbi:YfiR family protein [Enterovibrio sp. ZSDZ42]|uniref:YfiR family protein n=1 Tax=Enterovibrio gelatinilyticus TaxID=2899819 RepID=A0ABT5R053_9GAMM|nr:YfiR family protein [Enterovibrio sp. ZSDZ42]MDD1793658.1 YfiR family protein [Enterovibrio sp. ZSDZ42]